MLRRRKPSTSGLTPEQEFWSWWSTRRDDFRVAIESGGWGNLAEEISDHVNTIDPGLDWEFAKGSGDRHAFVVTAAGDPMLRATAHRLHRSAPPPDAVFEFHPSRQRKPNLNLDGFRIKLAGHDLELSAAEVAVTIDEQRQVADIVMFHPQFAVVDDQTATTVTFLLLDWILGEDGTEGWIGEIDRASERPADAIPATALSDIVDALAARNSEPTWTIMQFEGRQWPVLAVVRRPLKPIEFPLFDQHISISTTFTDRTPNGWPSSAALEQLRAFDDDLNTLIGTECLLAAHETSDGTRTWHLFADSHSGSVARIRDWCAAQPLALRVSDTFDPAWDAVASFR